MRASADYLRHGSRILEELVTTGRVAVIGAEYELESGAVHFFDGVTTPSLVDEKPEHKQRGRPMAARQAFSLCAAKLVDAKTERGGSPGTLWSARSHCRVELPPEISGESTEWAQQGLNLRPLPCEGSALPLSYTP